MKRLFIFMALALIAPVLVVGAQASPSRRPPVPITHAVPPVTTQALIARGRALFLAGCSYCHGFDARGISRRAPSLHGVGAGAADFYLETGRMPLSTPHAYPERARPAYPKADIRALVAYIASLGGPGIPQVDPSRGSLAEGNRAFADHCAGCHQVSARGGIVTGAIAPSLQQATASQIAEAIRVGPYVMPSFSERQIDQHTLNSIVRYVLSTHHPQDRGGWGIGHIGPIPEGMIAWLMALVALLIVARLVGERQESGRPPPGPAGGQP